MQDDKAGSTENTRNRDVYSTWEKRRDEIAVLDTNLANVPQGKMTVSLGAIFLLDRKESHHMVSVLQNCKMLAP